MAPGPAKSQNKRAESRRVLGMGNPSRLRARLKNALAQRAAKKIKISGFREAAVLVPIIERTETDKKPGSLSIGFTLRSKKLSEHAGQVSFPGGKKESGENHPVQTAIRESVEEIGLDPAMLEVLGEIDDVATPASYIISPVVGWLLDPPPFIPSPQEVEEFFEVDVSELTDTSYLVHKGERRFMDQAYPMLEYHAGPHLIWGATARILQHVLGLWNIADLEV